MSPNSTTNYQLRTASLEDSENLSHVDFECFPGHSLGNDYFVECILFSARSVLVAAHSGNDAPIGYVIVFEHQRTAGDCQISTLCVSPRFRRAGIGRGLLRLALNLSAEQGFARVHLLVEPSNSSALALYESEGFEESKIVRNLYGRGGDRMLLTRDLPHGRL